MKIAYLLLVHDQPRLVAELINSITSPDSTIYIHVDAKANEEAFRLALDSNILVGNIVFIKNRVHCHWGRYSLVEATLNILREACHANNRYDYFVLLSGRDFPIKSSSHIKNFLERNKGFDFLEYYTLPSDRINEREDGLYRVNRYHYYPNDKHKEFPPFSKKPILNPLFNSLSRAFQATLRQVPLGMKIYAGSQWWMLSSQTVKQVLVFLQENKSVETYFKNVWIPDEIFFQTVILHLKSPETKLVNDNYRLVLWHKPKGNSFIKAPEVLTLADFEQITKSDALFARKFDEVKSKTLIEALQKQNALS